HSSCQCYGNHLDLYSFPTRRSSDLSCLPAGLDQTGYITAHGSFAQFDAGKTKFAVYTVRTAGDAAAITLTHRARITRQFLQGNLGVPTLLYGNVDVTNQRLQFSTLGSVLGNQTSAHGLVFLHAYFGHVLLLVMEREGNHTQQRVTFVVDTGIAGEGDVQTTQGIDL